MNYLSVEGVAKRYGERVLFENITFYVNEGDSVALIAKNGTGKTSMLRLITGEESPDAGKISLHPHIRMRFLSQESRLNDENTVWQELYNSENPSLRAIVSYNDALASGDERAMEAAASQMDALQAWDFEARIRQILSRLQVDFTERKIGNLSGGQQKRVALAKVLIDDPDFLILDEPTNHLDLDMIEWLEEYLRSNKKTLLVVTHDRYFLDSVCTVMFELDHQRIYKYQGDYTYYLIKKAENNEMMQASHEKARNLYYRELEWIRRMPQARTTKSKSRIDAFFEVEKKAKRPPTNEALAIYVKPDYLGAKILELHNVSKMYDKQVLIDRFDYKFQKGDRVGIVGRNGTGKSTLLNMMAGLIQPDTGKVVHGETLKIGYYTQSGMQLKDDMRVIEAVQEVAEFVQLKEGKRLYAHQLLEHFLFDYKQQSQYISRLSGGEKRRLYLLTILMRNPNFLLLDEPTNDLDLMTLQVLEEYLQNFEGCFVIVSHDRHFMDKLVEHTFAFEEGGVVRDFPGNYTAYREFMQAQANQPAANAAKKPAANTAANTAASTNSPQLSGAALEEARKAVKRLEKQIEQLEAKKTQLAASFDDPNLSPQKIQQLTREIQQIGEQVEEKEMEWLEWQEKIGG